MNWHKLDCTSLPSMPWKNGGGSTTELARWPSNAGLDDFIWRASIATITSDGPFSTYENIDRIISLLEGPGIHLRADDEGIDHTLGQPLLPYAFSGEASIFCTAGEGPSRDFNIMTRRGCASAQVLSVREATELRQPSHGLLLAAGGRWTVAHGGGIPQEIRAGQGFWWHGASPDVFINLEPQQAPSSLLWAAIEIQGDNSCP